MGESHRSSVYHALGGGAGIFYSWCMRSIHINNASRLYVFVALANLIWRWSSYLFITKFFRIVVLFYFFLYSVPNLVKERNLVMYGNRRLFFVDLDCDSGLVVIVFYSLTVADVILWKKWCTSVSLLVCSTSLWFLFEHAGYNILTFIANVLLLLVVILFFWAKSASLLNRYLLYPPFIYFFNWHHCSSLLLLRKVLSIYLVETAQWE